MKIPPHCGLNCPINSYDRLYVHIPALLKYPGTGTFLNNFVKRYGNSITSLDATYFNLVLPCFQSTKTSSRTYLRTNTESSISRQCPFNHWPVRTCPHTPRRRPQRSCRNGPASPRQSRWTGGTRQPSTGRSYSKHKSWLCEFRIQPQKGNKFKIAKKENIKKADVSCFNDLEPDSMNHDLQQWNLR